MEKIIHYTSNTQNLFETIQEAIHQLVLSRYVTDRSHIRIFIPPWFSLFVVMHKSVAGISFGNGERIDTMFGCDVVDGYESDLIVSVDKYSHRTGFIRITLKNP